MGKVFYNTTMKAETEVERERFLQWYDQIARDHPGSSPIIQEKRVGEGAIFTLNSLNERMILDFCDWFTKMRKNNDVPIMAPKEDEAAKILGICKDSSPGCPTDRRDERIEGAQALEGYESTDSRSNPSDTESIY